jgi:hypothetical protein
MLTIIAANPDVAHSEELLYLLQNKVNPMDDWMIEFLRDASMYETNRTLLEQNFAQKQYERDDAAWNIVRYILNDTISDTLNHAEYRAWLGTIGSPRSRYMIADDYVACHNFDAAIATVNAMNDKDLDRYELNEKSGMLQWYNLLKQFQDGNFTVNEIQSKLQYFAPIASNITEYGLAGLLASNSLNKYNGDNYIHPIFYPNSGNSSRLTSTSAKKRRSIVKMNPIDSKTEFNTELIFPNPADDIITINLDNFVDNIDLLKITDLTGRAVIEQKIIGFKSLNINVSKLANGTYFVDLYKIGNKKIKSFKFVIKHN